MTDLELWTALVSDYTQTAIRLPTLTSRKIRAGIPQPLRGLVWQAMSGARDTHLEGLYETLTEEATPFEKVIGRDLARTFPQVEMFKQEGGAGQLDLGKVLRAFSLYDADVGYCQGLGFIVAPLLMNMAHSEVFCVLVRMMEGYDLRSMFTPTLSGLKLRLYQFEQLLELLAPGIAAHLKSLEVFPAMYVSQWFLSLFAVTCPLDTLHRVYDLLLAEGAPETMMRLGITLLVRNQEQIMTLEMEGVLQLLLSSDLWATYGEDDDLLINDVVSFTTSITNDKLAELEKQYESGKEDRPISQVKGLHSVAASFLGRINPTRLFSGSFASSSAGPAPDSAGSDMARTSSKVSSMTLESTSSRSSSTENAEVSSNSSFSRSSLLSMKKQTENLERENKQLNRQIEDLIEALGEAHRQVAQAKQLNDNHVQSLDTFKSVSSELLEALSQPSGPDVNQQSAAATREPLITYWKTELASKLTMEPLSPTAQLAADKIRFLESQLDDRNHEVGRMRLSLQSVKQALEATQKEKVKVEKALSDIRQRKEKHQSTAEGGIRELKLGRPSTSRANSQTRVETAGTIGPVKAFRRASTFNASIGGSAAPASPDMSQHSTSPVLSSTVMTAHEEEVDALRLELVQAKAAIAIAQQESEEAKYALRMSRNLAATSKGHAKRASVTRSETAPAAPELAGMAAATTDKDESSAKPTTTTSEKSSWFWKR